MWGSNEFEEKESYKTRILFCLIVQTVILPPPLRCAVELFNKIHFFLCLPFDPLKKKNKEMNIESSNYNGLATCFLLSHKKLSTLNLPLHMELLHFNISLIVFNQIKHFTKTDEPESLEDYFQKGALFGQKAALNLWYVDTRPTVSEYLKV